MRYHKSYLSYFQTCKNRFSCDATPIFFKISSLPCIPGSAQPLAATCSHLQPLAASRSHTSGRKWHYKRVAASGGSKIIQASGCKWPLQTNARESTQVCFLRLQFPPPKQVCMCCLSMCRPMASPRCRQGATRRQAMCRHNASWIGNASSGGNAWSGNAPKVIPKLRPPCNR